MTRQHYYYQLRENVLRHGQPATEESFFRLAALALQAELGDYDPDRHRAAYFDTQLYFPQWVNNTHTLLKNKKTQIRDSGRNRRRRPSVSSACAAPRTPSRLCMPD